LPGASLCQCKSIEDGVGRPERRGESPAPGVVGSASPVASIFSSVAAVLPPIPPIFTSVYAILDSIDQAAVAQRVAAILAAVPDVFAPVRAILAAVEDVLETVPPAALWSCGHPRYRK
jgi:hypothetical protein